MASQKLYFRGHRFQVATIIDWREPEFEPPFREPAGHFGRARPYAVIEAKGKGRFWYADRPMGFWRTFAAMDLMSANDTLDIVVRYGDPAGRLEPRKPTTSIYWPNLRRLLRQAAKAWDAVDDDGISRLCSDPERLATARSFLRDGRDALTEVRPVANPETGGLALEALTLGGFMLASAALMLDGKTPMMRCAECSHWFAFEHAATRYCSPACRLTAHRRKGA